MFNKLRVREEGQGLVEYALILVLVAIVVIAVLLTLGPQVGKVFSQVVCTLGVESCDVVTFKRSKYENGGIHVDAFSDGTATSSVSLTASPGGLMTVQNTADPHYHIQFAASCSSCEVTVTVTSSRGGSASVKVAVP